MGFERLEAERTLDTVERERVPLTGYAPEEFARSLVIAYERLCERHGQLVNDQVANAVWEIGRAVIGHPMVLLDGVEETLAWLSGRFRLLLLTKGDREVQEDKLTRSGLRHLFDAVHVVSEKDAEVMRELLVRYELQPKRTWMVGNSPRSDINPALEAGIGAVYVPHPNTWQLEVEGLSDPERVIVVDDFGELIDFFSDSEEEQRT